jgi:hypothetical protein
LQKKSNCLTISFGFLNLFIQCCVTFLESHGAAQKKKSHHRTWSSLFHAPTSSWCKASPRKQVHSLKVETGLTFPRWRHGAEDWRLWPCN